MRRVASVVPVPTCPQTGCSGLAPATELCRFAARTAATFAPFADSLPRFMDKSLLCVLTMARTPARKASGRSGQAAMTSHSSKPRKSFSDGICDSRFALSSRKGEFTAGSNPVSRIDKMPDSREFALRHRVLLLKRV
jgi:hypothetical protein